MSRIGNNPIDIPEKVELKIDGSTVTVKGPKGELTRTFKPDIKISRNDEDQVVCERPSDSKTHKSLHGLTRSLIESMIIGVVEGFEKRLVMEGVGYRVQKKGDGLEIQLGYSHPIEVDPPEGIELDLDGNKKIIVRGIDKQQVGEMAAKIRGFREPEPYKGKGVRYEGEKIRRKEGKTG